MFAMGSTRKAGVALAAAVLAVAAVAAGAEARTTGFPSHGAVVPGHSIGGIMLGMTEQQVVQRWGHGFSVCETCGSQLVWLYEYPGSEPLGAAIKFNLPAGKAAAAGKTSKPTPPTIDPAAKVVAVFTLGSPAGWGTKGAMMGDPVSNVYDLFAKTGDAQCIGFDAVTVRTGQSTMSFYDAFGVIYGYALTAPSQPACQ